MADRRILTHAEGPRAGTLYSQQGDTTRYFGALPPQPVILKGLPDFSPTPVENLFADNGNSLDMLYLSVVHTF